MLALWHTRAGKLHLTTLLTMFDESALRSRSHGVPRALMEAKRVRWVWNSCSAGWKYYEQVCVQALRELRNGGVEIAIFGDIDLEPHREWEARVCRQAGLEHCLPLWQRNRLELARESIALGFKVIVDELASRLRDRF